MMLLDALLIPGFLNSSPSSLTQKPDNVLYPFKEKHLWIKKGTGSGSIRTVPPLYGMVMPLNNDDYRDSQNGYCNRP